VANQVLTLGNQALVQLTGEQGMHSGPAWCLNQWQVMQTLRLRLGRSTP
jgi:hypothetical protein